MLVGLLWVGLYKNLSLFGAQLALFLEILFVAFFFSFFQKKAEEG